MTAARPHFVLVNGSENNAGATATIVEFVSDKFAELSVTSEVIHLADHALSPCGPCGDCNRRVHKCEIKDALPGIADRLIASDGLIYASPVHAFGLSSTMQTFVERLGVGFLRFDRPLADKIGGVISVGRRYAHASVTTQLQQNMLLNRMILPGSGYPAMVRTEQGGPLEDTEGVASVTALCVRLADVAHRIRPSEAGSSALAANERIF